MSTPRNSRAAAHERRRGDRRGPRLPDVRAGAELPRGPNCARWIPRIASYWNRFSARLRPLVPGAARRGTSDLAIGELKFSGNSVRCKRNTLLYHGTILYDFDLSLIGELLPMPPRQPDYRQGRPHGAFVTNLPASREAIREALIAAWQADATTDWPRERLRELVERRYGSDEWNFQR